MQKYGVELIRRKKHHLILSKECNIGFLEDGVKSVRIRLRNHVQFGLVEAGHSHDQLVAFRIVGGCVSQVVRLGRMFALGRRQRHQRTIEALTANSFKLDQSLERGAEIISPLALAHTGQTMAML